MPLAAVTSRFVNYWYSMAPKWTRKPLLDEPQHSIERPLPVNLMWCGCWCTQELIRLSRMLMSKMLCTRCVVHQLMTAVIKLIDLLLQCAAQKHEAVYQFLSAINNPISRNAVDKFGKLPGDYL